MSGNNLKVYTVIPNVSGHVGQWPEMLESVKSMEFDDVLFLPLTERGGSQSPYAVSHPFCLDPSLLDPKSGSNNPQQLEDLLRETGLAGCVDMVFNHVADDGFIAKNFPQWIRRNPDGTFKHAGYRGIGGLREWGDLVLLDYDHPDERVRKELWDYMSQYADLWGGISARTGGIIRLDNLHSGNERFLRHTLGRLKEKYYSIRSIGELFTSQEKKDYLSGYLGVDYVLATQWEDDHKFVPGLRRYLDSLHRTKGAGFFFPISTHDSGTPAEEYGCAAATIPRYTVSALLSMGATGIVQKVEYGQLKKLNFIGGNSTEESGDPVDFREFFRIVNRIGRKKVFYNRGDVRFVDNGHDAVIAGYRENGNIEEKFLVIANFDIQNGQSISIRPKDYGISFDTGRMPHTEGYRGSCERIEFRLPPCGAYVIQLHPARYVTARFSFDKVNRTVAITQSLN